MAKATDFLISSKGIFMRLRPLSTSAVSGLALLGSLTLSSTIATSAGAAGSSVSCASITKSVIVADGFTGATTPKVTPYNYTTSSANPANSLGTTIEKLSVIAHGSSKPPMTATQYMAYQVKQSAGAMVKTPVAGVSDFLDFGSGKEDGLGSTSKAGSVRLDAWVAGKYIFLTFIAPVSTTPSKPLLSFIKTTEKLF
jgi:hypothetical protein